MASPESMATVAANAPAAPVTFMLTAHGSTELDAIGDAEASMLSFADGAKPNSRLACQIKMSRELDGLVVALPEAQH